MTPRVAAACQAEGLSDTIAAVEMTGIYHNPVQRALRKAGFDTRIVHPFVSNHDRRPPHPPTPRPTTMIWKRSSMPRSHDSAFLPNKPKPPNDLPNKKGSRRQVALAVLRRLFVPEQLV